MVMEQSDWSKMTGTVTGTGIGTGTFFYKKHFFYKKRCRHQKIKKWSNQAQIWYWTKFEVEKFKNEGPLSQKRNPTPDFSPLNNREQ